AAPAVDPVPARGTNVEFVVPAEPLVANGAGHISMRVHERGVGETQSCGTGACAAAVAIRYWAGNGAPDDWQVGVPGGTVRVRFFPAADGREHVELSGPAVLVSGGSSPESQRCSESEPKFFWTTSQAVPPGASLGSHSNNSSCSSLLPIRIGGLDQMVSNCSDGSTSSGRQAWTLSRPRDAALSLVKAMLRSLTSTAHTVAPGDFRPMVRAIGPHPQPMSSRLPAGAGGGTSAKSTAVPLSTPSGLKMPPAVCSCRGRPSNSTSRVRRTSGLPGCGLK